ncbi:MAG: DUF4922 domain-containing protein, partial [Syntrophaceae bacterium]|nr:DUF4922 domain-containing protein [Syntrophaceae bacterium]
QRKTWPALAAAYAGLAKIKTKVHSCGGYGVYVQFNPARSVSSGAAVDHQSISKRPCFLCSHNLPCEQKGILYQKEYLILCNPAPIFEKHFTVVHLQHQPQAIAASMGRLLDITADMSPDFVVFYNGPACGASAPDHLHFQAMPAGLLPLPGAFPKNFRIIRNSSMQVYRSEETDRAVLVLAGSNKELLLKQFGCLMKAVQNATCVSDEPMINLLCSYENGLWRIMIFFRAKHRPDAFYQEGEQRIFISPGTIDMAGVVITPLEIDFNRLDGQRIRNIYAEVSLSEEMVNKIIDAL